MPYALLDDRFHSNDKVDAMGLDGAGLYARALSYCASNLTDGFVPARWLRKLTGRSTRLQDRLTSLGAWEKLNAGDILNYHDKSALSHQITVAEPGFYIRDFLVYNPSRSELEAMRLRKSKAGRKGANKRWSDTTSHSSSDDSSHSGKHGTSHSRTDGKTMARARDTPTPELQVSTGQPVTHYDGTPPDDHTEWTPTEDPVHRLLHAMRHTDPDTERQLRALTEHVPEAAFDQVRDELERKRDEIRHDGKYALKILYRIREEGTFVSEGFEADAEALEPTPNINGQLAAWQAGDRLRYLPTARAAWQRALEAGADAEREVVTELSGFTENRDEIQAHVDAVSDS